MAIEEGIYRICSVATGQDLTLHGNAEKGKLQCKDRDSLADSKIYRRQRWMIVRVPGSEDVFNIINMYWGVLVYVDKWAKGGEYWLKASPATSTFQAGHWSLADVDGKVRITWRGEGSEDRVLDVKDGKHKAYCRVVADSDADEKRWTLERDEQIDSQTRPFAKWMSHVPSDSFLSQLSIPGTHQTIAINDEVFTKNPLCQRRSVYEQLIDGVRAFDLRLGRFQSPRQPDCLFAVHAFIHEIFCWAAVLQSLKLFLTRFPDETVIVNCRNETGTEGFAEAFLEDFRPLFDANPSMFLEGGKRISDIKLEQARGKIMILIAREGPGQLLSTPMPEGSDIYTKHWTRESDFWGPNFTSAGMYNAWLPHKWGPNFNDCQKNVTKAADDENHENVYATWWNVSGLPACMNNPINFAIRARKWFPKTYTAETIGTGGSKHGAGLNWFDFYHEGAPVKDIVRSNKGCEGLNE
ncbi:Hypothetical protein R9X50_00760700 [Acrodontium crateriforme]|uniref:Phosphatidylinositol-specific phospholipase C X domain-containing protein n=1 Tax=Acrodontium crateriforme TaxID=150365 RepID=A0AAQ3MAE8_9PEZI|nr:Hypothetical protein R9X50_00760700 [Acrodontium crateriforme]